ncbi:MAG: glycine hydroxymethyltransferase [Acidimicrobiales bacterium]|nr:glycine hydroxymethyltransferase [Acidimicrobiales bacterium]
MSGNEDAQNLSPESKAFKFGLDVINQSEPLIADFIRAELENQRSQLKLIASENYASPAVLLAMGNWFSDKYAEGTPGHRFYAGCEFVDKVETLASEHAKDLFGASYAYVQPHSGIDANLVAFWALLSYRIEAPFLEDHAAKHVNDLHDDDWETLREAFGNQRMIGMSLDAGGHLTHGFRPNISGKLFSQRSYGVDPKTEQLDYGNIQALANEFRPLVIVAGYSAYPRKVNFAKMREIADSVDALLMVDMAHFSGLVAGKVFTEEYDPIPHAHIVTSTTHKSLRGPRGGIVLSNEPGLAEHIDKGCPMVLGGPLANIMAAKAVAFAEAKSSSFQSYAQQVVDNARALAEGIEKRGGRLVTGGTENHLVLVDVRSFDLTGRQAESALEEAGVIVNRNSIPFDPNGAWYTSGIRLGTPALTSIGMSCEDMDEVADIICSTLTSAGPATTPSGDRSKAKFILSDVVQSSARERSAKLLRENPLYPEVTSLI